MGNGWLGVCVIGIFGALLVTVVATAGYRSLSRQEAIDRGAILLRNAKFLVRTGHIVVKLTACTKCDLPLLVPVMADTAMCGECGTTIAIIANVAGN